MSGKLLLEYKQKLFSAAVAAKKVDHVKPGDLVRVSTRVSDGAVVRIARFEGRCIGTKSGSPSQSGFSILVWRVVDNVGIKRWFPVDSPAVIEVSLLGRGRARRAKLYYLYGRRGKSARIRTTKVSADVGKKPGGSGNVASDSNRSDPAASQSDQA